MSGLLTKMDLEYIRRASGITPERTDGVLERPLVGIVPLGWDTARLGCHGTAAIRYVIGPDIVRGCSIMRADLFVTIENNPLLQQHINMDLPSYERDLNLILGNITMFREKLGWAKAQRIMELEAEMLVLAIVGHDPDGPPDGPPLPEWIVRLAQVRLRDGTDVVRRVK